ncbi:MAG TPA: FtsX-like permease family protein [Vicinamibacterales bacterium]|nr:FtsX-like permease family protein [Vicinamibacterales bacterium]
MLYASYEQSPVYFANLVVRATLEPSELEQAIRRAVFDLNQSQSVLNVRTLERLKSYSVALRRREIGIRSALGASSSRLLRAVVGQGLFVTLLGLTIGPPGCERRPNCRSARRLTKDPPAVGAPASALTRPTPVDVGFTFPGGVPIGRICLFPPYPDTPRLSHQPASICRSPS